MSRISPTVTYLVMTLCLVAGAVLRAEARPNPMHPPFQLLDAQGKAILPGGQEPDQHRTCGQCHATAFIQGHTLPGHQQSQATCLDCHYEGGKVKWTSEAVEPDGLVKRDWLRIAKPAVANCGGCHGLTGGPGAPVSIPGDYQAAAYPQGGQAAARYQLTRAAGSIFSPQEVAASFLNLAGKPELRFSWDVHSRKLLQCRDCHYAPNNPQRPGRLTEATASLRAEPRRETIGEYLQQPDHRLATANCQSCHDPQQGHGFLPYRTRHFEAVACESCHVPRQFGPAEQMVDATLLDESGSPLVAYRGLKGEPANLNTAYAHGFEPPLVPLPPSGKPGGAPRLSPVNPVSRWYWASGGQGEPLRRETLQQALLLNGQYRPELVAALDVNRNGRLERDELKLDTAAKRQTVVRLLTAAGVKDPVIRSEVSLHPISHGVAERSRALSDCGACHGPGSRLNNDIVLASWAPGGTPPSWKSGAAVLGRLDLEAGGQVVWKPGADQWQKLYIFGATSQNWPDRLGLLLLLGVVFGVALHGGYRLVVRRHLAPPPAGHTRREYLFTAYERLWHWVMAVSVLALIVTGLQIHFPGWLHLLSAANVVAVHNYFGLILALNAFLALFYHLATAAIRQFIPGRQGMAEAVKLQTRYYLRDIFKGLPAPFRRSPERKLNVLQQITYLFLLNILFPFQLITGAMIWLVGKSPAVAAAIGGLHIIAPLHNLGSWMFISFLVAHGYLATTGHTVWAHVRGMIAGYEEVEVAPGTAGEKI